ncbi:MAG: tRNA (adenosine(37)-N6)-threonylcarbamoyltransferase complex ATPase subunit type 1 TsaE [Pseudomonadota bacterium]
MSAFGHKLATALTPGMTILLNGPIGAGKTHLARAIIQSLLPDAEEVPSPTYTLVQTYKADSFEIWHADLYRLSDSSELVELGLDEAIGTDVVIIEWPDRLPSDWIQSAVLSIDIQPLDDTRHVEVTAPPGPAADLLEGLQHV